jgi:hypothetical protein
MRKNHKIIKALAAAAALAAGSASAAPDLYFGARGSMIATLSPFQLTTPLLGVQFGANFGQMGVRASVVTDLSAPFQGFLGVADLTYGLGGAGALVNPYIGIGGGAYLTGGTITPLAHGLVGVEFRLSQLGVFVEGAPTISFGPAGTTFTVGANAGLNFHF